MYKDFFGFVEPPFSIVPNSRYLFLSQRHREAIIHLQAGLGDGGGFAMLTGEVGTGKTTVAKAIIASLDDQTKVGFILNPTFSSIELLEAICDEFLIAYDENSSLKQLTQKISQFLLHNHTNGIQTLVIVDEAQHLAADVLEQLRLLTNFETESRKLLKVLLVGQPELQQKLQMPQLRQLAQRITGRYHLLPLGIEETAQYVRFRLDLAGGDSALFPVKSLKYIATQTQGIPRLINLVCDASLKSAFQLGETTLSLRIVEQACDDVMAFQISSHRSETTPHSSRSYGPILLSLLLGVTCSFGLFYAISPFIDNSISEKLNQQYPIETIVIEQEILAPELATLLMTQSSLEEGISSLYQVWGYRASVMDSFCSTQWKKPAFFRCEKRVGKLETIAAANNPVVLVLNIDDVIAYAVLSQLESSRVTLKVNDQLVEFDQKWLLDIWDGDYYVIWPHVFDETLKQGMAGESVALLDERLSQALGENSRSFNVFDAEMKRKVETFQRWQGMEVDGIAGFQTLKMLEQMTQEGAPYLTDRQG